jgi:4-amino-4-deoxy-L-arabinose transferase-like glycosyltransferase
MNKKLLLAVFVQAAILVAMLLTSKIKYEDFALIDEEGNSTFVEFPYSVKSLKEDRIYIYELRGKVHLGIFSPRYYRIIPDDKILSLTINGKEVSLDSIPENQKRDYRKGFVINLSKYLQNGENNVKIKFEDGGGHMGIKVQLFLRDARSIAISLVSFLTMISFLFLISRKIGLPKRYSTILFLAIAIRIIYMFVTDYNTRGHDVYSHIEYIKYFVENWSFPPLEKATGGAFFHPPLYYIFAALIYSPISYFTNNNTGIIYFALQIFSLLASIGFVYFGIKTTRLIFACFVKKDSSILQKILPWVSCLLIAFWPSGIIHSTRISNDPLLYFSFAAAMYFWISLYLRGKNIHLIWATIYTTIAILTKLNGALLIPMAMVLFLLKGISGRIYFSRKIVLSSIFASLIILASLGVTMYPGIALKSQGKRDHIYLTNFGGMLIVGKNLENLVFLDVKTFITEPFISPFEDKYGRQYFPNYIGKTALFGEWSYKDVTMHNIATAMSILALAMFIISLIFLFKIPIKDLKFLLPILLISIFLLCGVTHTRITFPVNIDFRYILPIIIPFFIFYNYGINLSLLNGKKRFAVSAMFLELLFCLLSALFILQLWLYNVESWIIGAP